MKRSIRPVFLIFFISQFFSAGFLWAQFVNSYEEAKKAFGNPYEFADSYSFHHCGPFKISALYPTEKQEARLIFKMIDTGEPLKEENCLKIFEEFFKEFRFQPDSSRSNEMMTIWVDTDKKIQATFFPEGGALRFERFKEKPERK